MAQKRLNLGEKLYKSKNVTFAFFDGHSLISYEMKPLQLMQIWRLPANEFLQVGSLNMWDTLWNMGHIEIQDKCKIQYFTHYT